MADVRRVAVFGPESTGKTTLAAGLAAHFAEPWAPEFVREYWDLRDGQIGPGDLGSIALGQLRHVAFGVIVELQICDFVGIKSGKFEIKAVVFKI